MQQSKSEQKNIQQAYMQHAEELLCHTSRYYACTEDFLSKLSGQANFSMTGYHSNHLSEDQRQLLAALMMERPTEQNGQIITQIISDVVDGKKAVDEQFKVQFSEHFPSSHFLLHHYVGGHGFSLNQTPSPTRAINDLAQRLLIPIEVEGERVKLSFSQLGSYLDSSNPTIRHNVLESIQQLYAGGHRLVNQSALPIWHIDLSWNRLRISLQLIHCSVANRLHFNPT